MIKDSKEVKEEIYRREMSHLEEKVRILQIQKYYLLELIRLEGKWQKLYFVEKHSRQKYQKAFGRLSSLPFFCRTFYFRIYTNRLSKNL